MLEITTNCVMCIMLAISIVTDLRTGKILNWLTLPCAMIGLTIGIIERGTAGIGDRLAGMAVVLVVMLLLSPFIKLGGGDTKLLMAVGALQGLHFTIWVMLLTGLAGGVLAMVVMFKRRIMKQTATNLVVNLASLAAGASTDLAMGSATKKMQYSIAIAAGALATLALGV